MHLRRPLALALLAATLAPSLVACSDSSADPIRIGTTNANLREWSLFQDLATDKGFDIEIVTYADYSTANEALASGQLDLNNFQHLSYLAGYNVRNDTDLTPLAATAYFPLGLYWKKHTDLDDLDTVYIPIDPANHGRAISLLTAHRIDPASLTIHPVEPADLIEAYDDGEAAIIPNTELQPAGIEPDEALALDQPEPSWTYVWATTPDRARDAELLELVDLWHDPEVAGAVIESSGGTAIPLDTPHSELKRELDALEQHLGG